jgi:LmbE family N-acetylglucosaminyl deacetylase
VKPNVILTFDPWKQYEFHPDHRAVGLRTTEARMFSDLPWVCPEHRLSGTEPYHPSEIYLFNPQTANYWVDISDHLEEKIQACLSHNSQLDLVRVEADLERYKQSIMNLAQKQAAATAYRYAEAFYKVDDSDFEI